MGAVTTVTVFATCGGREEADRIARTLVEERLAACVNVLPGVTSVYRWEGALQEDEEVVLLAKTREALADAVRARIEALHAYDLPCVVVLPHGASGSARYRAWVEEQTAG